MVVSMGVLMDFIVATQQKTHGQIEAWFGSMLLVIALILGWSSYMITEQPYLSWIWLAFLFGIISIIAILDGAFRVHHANADIDNLKRVEYNQRDR
jgi:hypothetical protein